MRSTLLNIPTHPLINLYTDVVPKSLLKTENEEKVQKMIYDNYDYYPRQNNFRQVGY